MRAEESCSLDVGPAQEKEVNKAEKSLNLKRTLTTHMDMYSLKFALLAFALAFVFTVHHFIHFGMVMHIQCYCMLKICDLLFVLIL